MSATRTDSETVAAIRGAYQPFEEFEGYMDSKKAVALMKDVLDKIGEVLGSDQIAYESHLGGLMIINPSEDGS